MSVSKTTIVLSLFACLASATHVKPTEALDKSSTGTCFTIPEGYEIRVKPSQRLQKRNGPPTHILDSRNLCRNGAETTWDYLHLKMIDNGRKATYKKATYLVNRMNPVMPVYRQPLPDYMMEQVRNNPMIANSLGWGNLGPWDRWEEVDVVDQPGMTSFCFHKPEGVDWWKAIRVRQQNGVVDEVGGNNRDLGKGMRHRAKAWTDFFNIKDLKTNYQGYVEVEIWKATTMGVPSHVKTLLFDKTCLDGRSVEITFTRD